MVPKAFILGRSQQPRKVVEGQGAVRVEANDPLIGFHGLPLLAHRMIHHGQVQVEPHILRLHLDLPLKGALGPGKKESLFEGSEMEPIPKPHNAHEVENKGGSDKAVVFPCQPRFRRGSPQYVDPLPDAEMVPARQVSDLAAESGDFFQGADNLPGASKNLGRIQVRLPFEVAHEEPHDIAEVEDHGEKHGESQDKVEEACSPALSLMKKVRKKWVRRQEVEKNVEETEGQDHESQEKEEVEEEMTVLGMAHFMGDDRLQLVDGEDFHQGFGDQDIPVTGHHAHDSRGEHPPPEDGPLQHPTIFEFFFSQKRPQLFRLFRSRIGFAAPPRLDQPRHKNDEHPQEQGKEDHLARGVIEKLVKGRPGDPIEQVINKGQKEPGEKDGDIETDVGEDERYPFQAGAEGLRINRMAEEPDGGQVEEKDRHR